LEGRFATLPYRRPATLQVDASFAVKQDEKTEYMALKQAKLVLGLRVAVSEPAGDVDAAQLMCTLLGGCPTSLLFTNVREKKSLCYYCAATYDRHQGVMLIDSGVQPESVEMAKEEILKQLEALRQGEFTDDELEAARRSLIQRHASANDNPEALESFYIGQTLYDTYATPDEKRSRVLAVTREDVCRAARLAHFDTTYLLAPNEEVDA
jgi:predicted Zn-dependent peptidase